jgi:hypothetical protein
LADQIKMKISEICSLVAKAHGDNWKTETVFAELTVIEGRDYWGDAEKGWWYAPGREPKALTLDLEIDATFLQYDYTGHYPISVLFIHPTEEIMIQSVSREGGYLSPFCSLTVLFYHGQIRPFVCHYTDEEGREHIFSKSEQQSKSANFEEQLIVSRFTWL